MTRTLGLKLALAAVATLATFAVAEVALRIVAPPPPSGGLRGLFVPRLDRPWLYGLRPGAEAELPTPELVRYSINADGFRDRVYARPKPEGVFRVAVLGDSLAMGYGVEQDQGFVDRIEAALVERAPEARIEVLNFGVGAYNAYNERALLDDVVLDYEPDLVLVQFCINDLNDPTLHFGAATRFVLAEIPDAAFPDPRARAPVPTRSHVAALCRQLRICSLAASALSAAPDAKPDAALWRGAFELRHGAEHATEWRWLEDNYKQMAESSARHGARFAVLAFPFATQLEAGTTDSAQRHLNAMGRSNGWPTVDLLPAFRAAARSEGAALFEDAWHPTRRGHRVAADAIVRELACLELLPPAAARLCPAARRAVGRGDRAHQP